MENVVSFYLVARHAVSCRINPKLSFGRERLSSRDTPSSGDADILVQATSRTLQLCRTIVGCWDDGGEVALLSSLAALGRPPRLVRSWFRL